MLEELFYLNVGHATYRDYFDIAIAQSQIMKGGSPQLWYLISREIAKAFKDGKVSEEDIATLVEYRMTAKSSKFFLTDECLSILGIEESLQER